MARRRDPFLDDVDSVETTVELTCVATRTKSGLMVQIVRPVQTVWEYLDVSRFLSHDEVDRIHGEIQEKADGIIKKKGGFLKWLSKK